MIRKAPEMLLKHTNFPLRPAAALLALAVAVTGCNQKSAEPASATSAAVTALAEAPVPDASAPLSFEAELEFIDLVFKLKTHGYGARRLLTVTASRSGVSVGPSGSAVLDGGITNAFAADLNGDQQAEIVVITKGPDGKTGFTALAFNGSAYREYRLPEPQDSPRSDADEYAFDNGQIVRRSASEAGGSRTLRYKFDPATGFVPDGG